MNLTPVDIKILSLLQENASLTAAEIAEQVNLSPSPCWRRINRLEQSGVIEKKVALLDAEKLGLGLVVFFGLLGKLAGPVMADGSALAWLMVSGSMGVLIAFLWWGTDHTAAGPNLNILLLNPLFLMGLLPALRRPVAWLMFAGLGLAGLQGVFPGSQYNLDVLAFLTPLHLACAWRLLGDGGKYQPWISRAGQAGQPRSSEDLPPTGRTRRLS